MVLAFSAEVPTAVLVATALPPRPTTTPFTLSVVPTLVRLEAVTPDASVAPVNVDALATLAVEAYDADVAADVVFAKDAVPNNEPVKFEDIAEAVNDPIATPEPDINTDPVN